MSGRAREPKPESAPSLEDCSFYQTIELPEYGVVKGAWDHRKTADTYLGYVDFTGRKALDIGPANGFFSFEMERLGAAQVTALDLGQSADWDAVPNPSYNSERLKTSLRLGVRRVENAFWLCHRALDSNVRLAYGSIYDTARAVDEVDIALIGNLLQHVRDPFLAIERASQVVTETIVVSEAVWIDEPTFLEKPDLRLLTKADKPELNQSWWAVSPVAVIEILRLLGFVRTRCEYHEQEYCRMNRRIRHFTVTGSRASADTALRPADDFHLYFAEGWNTEERNERESWHWSSRSTARISITLPPGEHTLVKLDFRLVSLEDSVIELSINGKRLSRHRIQAQHPIELSVELENLREGGNRLDLASDANVSRPAGEGTRSLGFGVFNLTTTTGTRHTASVAPVSLP